MKLEFHPDAELELLPEAKILVFVHLRSSILWRESL
jgi:hypothetical protein